ncbi:MAG TPA: PilN domain-containing protein [Gemmatimonadales bacterium]|nr:PilN domain-containing protein [Gemmatimonadales bacterium]
MITVNLRPGLKRKRAGSPLAGVTERMKGLGASVKDPMLMVVAASWVIVVLGVGGMWLGTAHQLGALEPELESTRAENQRFRTFLAEKHKQELIRDSIVAQIRTIRSVDGDRYVWPHVLDEVTKALPPFTWLVDMSPTAAPTPPPPPPGPANAKNAAAAPADTARPPLAFQIDGRTVDIQAYTRFLRQLEASPWITDVTPISAATVVEQNRAITAFTIRASFKQADSAYVRTVPLSQSVR